MKTKLQVSPLAVVAALILAAQGTIFFTMSHGDAIPLRRPLAQFPEQLGAWSLAQDDPIDQETRDVLGANDYLNRVYRSANADVGLYVAYWETQQTGQTPHSPKNCLPGNGWVPSFAGTLNVPVPGKNEPIRVNQYIVARGGDKALVLYWYQSNSRVIASDYTAKIYTVFDSLRYHRSDTALVRVLISVPDGHLADARKKIINFVQSFFNPLCQFLPA